MGIELKGPLRNWLVDLPAGQQEEILQEIDDVITRLDQKFPGDLIHQYFITFAVYNFYAARAEAYVALSEHEGTRQ